MVPTPPIVAILTDFGESDWYVASVKAVLARLCPEAKLIDITHQVEPGNIRSGAFILSQCYHDFPRGTVFLCVVDPGVGSSRKPIIHFDGDYHFVAPDNGLLSLLESGMCRTYEIEPHRFDAQVRESNTFHGRDIFAPAAAFLANGVPPSNFCTALPKFAHEGMDFPEVTELPMKGSTLYFDQFGNAITSLRITRTSPKPEAVVLKNGDKIPFGLSFHSVPKGKPVAYLGSGGFLEIAVNLGSARVSLNLEDESDFELV
ncbi:SAM-dependent chlorinase/fluorinase [Pelagicoccus sp. NFK12]|uniref:SAM-dependent chlorinase/fluorinase n=1 Tax=Pelagicoccus enzymogenes TaxID=2773457 RepID=A0A927IGI4_9BACT|nr:SAM-dependent chlorinase/fluorinase [Pelagicoccus enzymogenes]MBD5779191.1 SAM-dependent chlorinase/fluorinase [Pelagicoccus enzymogenes]MDQ8198457.1 SAM-dependent chlorinase/fluorinase [Pelagicoccus enzymogenes]